MADDTDILKNLLEYVQAEGKICPQPQEWNALWEMLPDKKRVGYGCEPNLPLILSAWWHTVPLEKMNRFREHIEYAAAHGVLDEVNAYLRGLSKDQWHTIDNK